MEASDERTAHRLEAFSDIVIGFGLAQLGAVLTLTKAMTRASRFNSLAAFEHRNLDLLYFGLYAAAYAILATQNGIYFRKQRTATADA